MPDKTTVLELMQRAVDELNEQRPADAQISKTPDTVLFGKGGQLDSLGLVNLTVAIEERLADDLEIDVTIADEKAMSQSRSPFRTLDALADYVLSLVSDEQPSS